MKFMYCFISVSMERVSGKSLKYYMSYPEYMKL